MGVNKGNRQEVQAVGVTASNGVNETGSGSDSMVYFVFKIREP